MYYNPEVYFLIKLVFIGYVRVAFKKGLSKYKEERLEFIANKYNLNYKEVEEGFTNLMLSTRKVI